MPNPMDKATAALAEIGARRGAQQAAISQQKPITPIPQQAPQMPPPQQAMQPQMPPQQPPGQAGMKRGGKVKKMASGGMASSASKRGDGCATKGKTKGRFV